MTKDNLNCTTGANLRCIKNDAIKIHLITKHQDVLEVNTKSFKHRYKYEDVPEDSRFKIQMMNELISMRDREIFLNEFDFGDDLVLDMINFICTE